MKKKTRAQKQLENKVQRLGDQILVLETPPI